MNFLSVTGTMSYIDYYHTHILYFKWYFIRKQTHLFTNNVSICIWHRHRAITSATMFCTIFRHRGGHGLRHMCLHCIQLSCDFSMNYWETDRDQSWSACNFSGVITKSPQKFYGVIFCNKFIETRSFVTRSSHGLQTTIVWESCNASTICLRVTAYIIFMICITVLYKIVVAATPVNPYDIRTVVAISTRRHVQCRHTTGQ